MLGLNGEMNVRRHFGIWPFLDRISVRVQIAVATVVICASVGIGGAVTAAMIGRAKAVELIGRQMAEQASSMTDHLDRGMFERYREIGVIAGSDLLRPVWERNPRAMQGTLELLQKSLPDYAWIGFATPDGQVRAATRQMLEGTSVAERPWFMAGKFSPYIGDVHEAVLLGGLLGSRPQHEPFRFVDIAHPVFSTADHLIGVLGAHLSWDWAAEVREAVLALNQSSAGVEIIVLDAEGRALLGAMFGEPLLAPAQVAQIKQQRRGHGLSIGPDPDAWMTGYSVSTGHRGYPGLDWIVIARQPSDIAGRPVRDLVLTIILAGIGLSLLGGMAAWWVAGRLTRPIRAITAEADRIGRDPAAHMLARHGGTREVAQLSRALRSLLRRLGLTEEKLHHAKRDIEEQAVASRALSENVERLRELADIDPLSGLLNRRGFLDRAGRQFAIAQRYRHSVAIVVADIDHFKQVNDRYGHAAGDAAIRSVCRRLQAAARETDLLARFGGEEFVIMLMESNIEAATAYAERARRLIAETPVELDAEGIAAGAGPETGPGAGAPSLRLTISLGCTSLRPGDRDVQDAIDRADLALYAAKTAGRNQVRTAPA